MRSSVVVTILLASASAVLPVAAQDSPALAYTGRRVTGMLGLGNTFGGFGGTLEYFLSQGRASVFIGLGALPGAGVTAAGGMRVHTGGTQHRLFLEAAVSPLAVSVGPYDDRTRYGPAISVGYNYATLGGFSLLIGGGAGWAPAIDAMEPVLNLGFGYTWRR